MLLTCAFAASYDNAEIERYYLGPVLIAWTWLAILAVASSRLTGALGRDPRPPTRSADDPARGREAGRRVASTGPRPHPRPRSRRALLLIPTAFALPDRLARVDRSRDLGRPRVARSSARRPCGRDAVVVSWWSYSTPLWYAQHIEGQRPDLTVIDDRTRLDQGLGDVTDVIDANLPTRPVYVIRVDPAELATLERRYVLEPVDGDRRPDLTARRLRVARPASDGDRSDRGRRRPRPLRDASPACRTSSRRTTRKPTSPGLVEEALDGPARRSPTRSRSSSSTTARATGRRPSPTS